MAIYAMAPMPPALLDQVAAIYPNAAVILGSAQTEVVPATVMQWPQHQLTMRTAGSTAAPSMPTASSGSPVVWFTDRLKDIIKTGGENVSSVKVESICMDAPGVAECSIICLPDEKWGEAVCAVIMPDGSVPDDELADSLIAYAKAHLAGFQVPKEMRIVPALPKTATGKIQKHELRRQAREV